MTEENEEGIDRNMGEKDLRGKAERVQSPWGRRMESGVFRETEIMPIGSWEREESDWGKFHSLSDLAIWEQSAHFMTKETFQHYPKSINFITSARCKVYSWYQNAIKRMIHTLSVIVSSLYVVWNVTSTTKLDKTKRKLHRRLNDALFLSFRNALLTFLYYYIRN